MEFARRVELMSGSIMPQCVDFQQGGCVHDLLSLKSCGLLLGALGP